MINPFKIKKWAALILAGLLPVLSFYITLTFYNFMWALIMMGVGLLLSVFIASILIENPFTKMLEGKGLLCVNMDSTGVLKFFTVALNNPFIRGKFNKSNIQDIFNRETVSQIAPAQKTQHGEYKDGKLTIELDTTEFNEARFAFFHYPLLIWNDQTKSLLTKDFFSEKEKNAFAEHGVLYLNKQVEHLNSALLNFGRYIVESIRPKGNIWENKWIIIIIVIALIVVVIMAAPFVMQLFEKFIAPASDTISGAASGGALTVK